MKQTNGRRTGKNKIKIKIKIKKETRVTTIGTATRLLNAIQNKQ